MWSDSFSAENVDFQWTVTNSIWDTHVVVLAVSSPRGESVVASRFFAICWQISASTHLPTGKETIRVWMSSFAQCLLDEVMLTDSTCHITTHQGKSSSWSFIDQANGFQKGLLQYRYPKEGKKIMIFNTRVFSKTVGPFLETRQREVWKNVTWRKNNTFKQTTKSQSYWKHKHDLTWKGDHRGTPHTRGFVEERFPSIVGFTHWNLNKAKCWAFFSCRIKPSQKPEAWFVLRPVVPVALCSVMILNRGRVSLLGLLPAILISTRRAMCVSYSLSLPNKSCFFRHARWKAGVPSYGF